MIFHNGRILTNGSLIKKDVEVKDGLISAIEGHIEGEGIDLKGAYLCPGLTDIHVHFREPGNPHKESIRTGSLAAAKGGYTTVLLMPNLNPCPDCLENLKIEEDIIARDAVVECLPYASVTLGEKSERLSDIESLKSHTSYFSDDGVGINDLSLLDKALKIIKKEGLFIASHAEDAVYKTKPKGEYLAVRREIELAKKNNVAYHFCHMSTRESFAAIKKAQEEGFSISC
ncbi:MAG: amidohydrolase family protein [Bacilli bacterium]|nr:amidohydrolase family protein [Bacilli bacterium]